MDFKIKKRSWFISNRIKKAWLRMECESSISPFLYYNYMRHVIWNTIFLHMCKPIFYYAEDNNGNIIMIAPLVQSLKTGAIDTLGNINYCDITDILFDATVNFENKRKLLYSLQHTICKDFYLSRLLEDSDTLKALEGKIKEDYTHDCVAIHIADTYDSHIASLSKSVRQNIRTAYNRMDKAGIHYKFYLYNGGNNIPDSIKKDTHNLYNKRQFKAYLNGLNLFQKFKAYISLHYLRHDNFSLYNNENAVHAVLYYNGQIAAMFAGILNWSGTTVCIPRLAINEDFKFYSPGYVLLCETMKFVLKHNDIRHIDLCRGSEKYKIDLGGAIYKSVFAKITG